jgi:hypothetical protein
MGNSQNMFKGISLAPLSKITFCLIEKSEILILNKKVNRSPGRPKTAFNSPASLSGNRFGVIFSK